MNFDYPITLKLSSTFNWLDLLRQVDALSKTVDSVCRALIQRHDMPQVVVHYTDIFGSLFRVRTHGLITLKQFLDGVRSKSPFDKQWEYFVGSQPDKDLMMSSLEEISQKQVVDRIINIVAYRTLQINVDDDKSYSFQANSLTRFGQIVRFISSKSTRETQTKLDKSTIQFQFASEPAVITAGLDELCLLKFCHCFTNPIVITVVTPKDQIVTHYDDDDSMVASAVTPSTVSSTLSTLVEPIPSHDQLMRIFIDIFGTKTITLDVYPNDTVEMIKEKISTKEGIPATEMRITSGERTLEHGRTLADYQIMSSYILRMMISQRGGMYHFTSGRDDYSSSSLTSTDNKDKSTIKIKSEEGEKAITRLFANHYVPWITIAEPSPLFTPIKVQHDHLKDDLYMKWKSHTLIVFIQCVISDLRKVYTLIQSNEISGHYEHNKQELQWINEEFPVLPDQDLLEIEAKVEIKVQSGDAKVEAKVEAIKAIVNKSVSDDQTDTEKEQDSTVTDDDDEAEKNAVNVRKVLDIMSKAMIQSSQFLSSIKSKRKKPSSPQQENKPITSKHARVVTC